jgi:hypothetical protein
VNRLAWEEDRTLFHTSSELIEHVHRRAPRGYRPLLVSGVWQPNRGESLYHVIWVH